MCLCDWGRGADRLGWACVGEGYYCNSMFAMAGGTFVGRGLFFMLLLLSCFGCFLFCPGLSICG